MTSSKLRIKDDLYNRLSPVQPNEMLYKESNKSRSSSTFFHAVGYRQHDSSEELARYSGAVPSQVKTDAQRSSPSPNQTASTTVTLHDDDNHSNATTEMPPNKSALILQAHFYQNLFAASATLFKQQRPAKRRRVHVSANHFDEASNHSEDEAGIDEKAEDLSSPLETALASVGQFPKGLFPNALSPNERQDGGRTADPHVEMDRDVDTSESNEMLEKPSNAFPWLSEATNNNDYTKGNNNHHGTPPHLHHPHHPHHHHHHHHHPHHSHHLAASSASTASATQSSLGPASTGNCRHGHHGEDSKCRALNCGGPPPSPSAGSSLAANEGATPDSSSTTATATAIPNFNQMPVPGGVQGQNPTQGLVHWMSAVMAEHMTSNPHHDPAAVGMHYMWNGPVE
uniref:Uncharacterized protein n=1 Tax=Anopheles epiroticus TaxID=199890 RepID=A0A182PT31_9DIPT